MLEVKWDNLDAAFESLEQECTDIVRGLLVETWNKITHRTPQYFGGMAASWTFTYSPNNFVDRSEQVPGRKWYIEAGRTDKPEEMSVNPFDPVWKGHPFAISIANQASAGKEMQFKLGRKVYFTNGVDHGEGEYSKWVEDHPDFLRSINQPGKAVGRTLDSINAKFSGGISKASASRLKELRLWYA